MFVSMSVNPDLVDDSDMPPDAQRGFRFYLTSSNHDGDRSLLATSNALELPINTIRSWSTRYGWPRRAKSIDQLENDESYTAALVRAARMRLRIVDAYAEIAFPKAERVTRDVDRIAALDRLAAIAGLAHVAAPVVVNVGDAAVAAYDPAALAQLSPSQLMDMLRGVDPLPFPASPALPPPADSDPLP